MKKFISGLLCAVMTAGMFAGCSGNATTVATTENTPAANTAEVSEAPAAEGSAEAPAAVEEGSAETPAAHTLSVMGPMTTNPYIHFEDREEYPVWQEFMKLLAEKGLTLEFEAVASDQYLTVIQTRLASATDLPDFVQFTSLDNSTALNLVDQGMLLPVNDIISEHSDGTAKDFFETGLGVHSNALNTTEDGNVYWISQIQATSYDGKPGSTSMGMNIRTDWLEKVGLEMPTNADEFYNALKAFKDNDVNGNGEADEILVFDPDSWQNGIAQWFGLVGEVSSFVLDSGEVTSPWYQPGAKDYFAYVNKLVTDGLADPSIFGNETSDQRDQRVAENKASAVYNYCMATWDEPATGDPNAMYVQVDPAIGVEGITPVLAVEPPRLSYNRWGFTKACEDLEAAGILLDVLCSEEYITLCQWGIEGDTYEEVDGKRRLLDIALNANWEQAANERKTIGDFLWANGFMFPKRRFVPMEDEISIVPEAKAEYQVRTIDYKPQVPLGNENYLPVMSKEQVERRLELITDLNTRSKELAIQLCLGQASLDNWDSYIAELDALGLAEVVAIDQALLDRAAEMGF